MTNELCSITVENFRTIRELTLPCGGINLLFGPNGVGKSTFLDALWFLRDCAIRGTEQATSERHHGVGILWEGADPSDVLKISLGTNSWDYAVSFGFTSGRIESFVGERLYSKSRSLLLIDRRIGSEEARFYHESREATSILKLRDPEKLAFAGYLLGDRPSAEAAELDELLRSVHYYHSRATNFHQLRRIGSESSVHTYPLDRWQNLWSVLRNLSGRRAVDGRYDEILKFMREGFPDSFRDLVFEPAGPDRVSASFVEANRRHPIHASGASDGHLQLLGLLSSLFGEPQDRSALLIFDEPETSLHPHAIAIFAKAVQVAVDQWNRQIFIATHSPVLMSQFREDQEFVFSFGKEHETQAVRVSEVHDLRDLLDHYAVGSLFMSETLGSQNAY